MTETSPTISNFDNASCASFSSTSESNTNDFVNELLSTLGHHLFTPFSNKRKIYFQEAWSYMKGKFNPNITIEKDGKNKESKNDDSKYLLLI